MKPVSMEDLARVSLPNRGERGWLVMLECYLDDSGTHAGSPVIVWGGVSGHKFWMDQLDARWRAQLLRPCDSKPPIKAFHSYDLDHGIGEFEGYNQGARDLTRRNFRQVIVETGVTVVAFGVSVKDWDQLVRSRKGLEHFTAEEAVFGKAIFDMAKAAREEGEALSLHFDQGRDTPHLRRVIKPALQKAEYDGHFVSYGFAPVGAVPALQAADLVVHEAFGAFRTVLADPDSEPRLHTKRLFEDPFGGAAKWLGRKQIKDTIRSRERAHKREAKLAKRSRV